MRFEWIKRHADHPPSEVADERAYATAIAHRNGTPVAREPGFPGAEKKPALPESLCDDAPRQLTLFEFPGERV